MEFMNIVRMRIKAGKFEEWQKIIHENMQAGAPEGLLDLRHVKYGENEVCVVGRWASREALAAARPRLVQGLDRFRHLLDGETDPISGAVILDSTKMG